MLFRISLLALALSFISLSRITSVYGSHLEVDEELRDAVEKVKSKCNILFTPKYPKGLPASTGENWNIIEKKIKLSMPSPLRFLFDELNSYETKGKELAHVHDGILSQFVDHNLDAWEKGLPREWVTFCYDNADYHCYNITNGQVAIWNPYEEQGEEFVETLSNLASWLMNHLYPSQLKK